MFRALDAKSIDNSPALHKAVSVPGAKNKLSKVDPTSVIGGAAIDVISKMPLAVDSFFDGVLKGLNGVLANPVLQTTGRDALATVDVWGKQINTPQNVFASIVNNVFGTGDSLLSAITKNPTLMEMTGQLITTGKVNKDTRKKYFDQFGNNLLQGVIGTAAGTWLEDAGKQIGFDVDGKGLIAGAVGLPGKNPMEEILKLNPTIAMISKGVEVFTDKDFDHVAGLFRVMDNLTSGAMGGGTIDLKAESVLMNSITKSLMAFNDAGLFKKAIEKYKARDKDDPAKTYTTAYLLDNIDNAIYGSSFEFIDATLAEIDASKILDTKPNFIMEFLANFFLKTGEDPTVAIADKLLDMLTRIDPNWNKTTLAPQDPALYNNIAVYQRMSSDVVKLLLLKEDHMEALALSSYYRNIPLTEYLRTMYPVSPIS